jgi:SAM-dependent methyltransferase
MSLFLNFGAGRNQLPEPWQNLNAEHDIRKPLRFEDGSASRILAEHVIEHVPFLQGVGFLQECARLLEPGGVLRLAFPDPARLLARVGEDGFELGRHAVSYATELGNRPDGELIRATREKARAGALMMLVGWNHQCAWTVTTAAAALCAVGFGDVKQRRYGCSDHAELERVDGHHQEAGDYLALFETTVLEATK